MTRRERLRAEMFREITRTARALLSAGGPNAMSVRAIAREIRVTPAAIYRYHPSLHTLVAAVQDDILDELTARLAAVRDRADYPSTRLRDMARTFRHWALENPAEFRLLFAHPDQVTSPRVSEFITYLLADSVDCSPSQIVATAWSRLYGLIATELSGHLNTSPATADAIFEQALEDLSPLADLSPLPTPSGS